MDIIAVHAGAGFQSESNRAKYLKVCSEACAAGIRTFAKTGDPVDAVTTALMVLENDELTNAGYGSNLCSDGTAECDASIMSGDSLRWSGIGALSGVKNPIALARRLLRYQSEELPCGLVPPNLLVGEGARKWATEQGICSNNNLVTSRTLQNYNNYKRRVEDSKLRKSGSKGDGNDSVTKRGRLDTIGAVAISKAGIVASGVSSGGVNMKLPGRVGQAAMYGAGCWAKDNVAVTTSGVGEYLTRTFLAKAIADSMTDQALEESHSKDVLLLSFTSSFLESPLLKNIKQDDRKAGLLAILKDPHNANNVEVLVTHNTPSMCVGFMTSDMQSPETIFSLQPGTPNPVNITVNVVSLAKTD